MAEKQTSSCRACGKSLKDTWGICPYCATPLHLTCAACGKELETDFNNCPYCGALVTRAGGQGPSRQDNTTSVEKIAAGITVVFSFLSMVWERALAGAKTTGTWTAQNANTFLQWLRSRKWGEMLSSMRGITNRLVQLIKNIREKVRAMEWGTAGDALQKFASAVGPAVRKNRDGKT
jgi:RNA polymerase subunit RPABC4/transcription elongation factor Spt4